ncbi:MAG: hypothetical protein HQL69_06215 [Magnetococcales bacterium]|nr:hypothetical protein [Magnetococcales bacterium]
MMFLEQKYRELQEVVNFKKDLNWRRVHYKKLNLKLYPSYNAESYLLMNKAASIIVEIEKFISNNSGLFTTMEIDIIQKLREICHHSVTKANREDAFYFLEECINHRAQHVSA